LQEKPRPLPPPSSSSSLTTSTATTTISNNHEDATMLPKLSTITSNTNTLSTASQKARATLFSHPIHQLNNRTTIS
jgi:hypothetical protein